MKKTILLLILFFNVSCQFFETTDRPNEAQLLEQRIKEIDWKTVDQLPIVGGCDRIMDFNEQKKCFFEYLTQTINRKIDKSQLLKLYPKNSVLTVKVSVFPNQPLIFEAVLTDSFQVYKSKIDQLLQNSLIDFPAIIPAIKQGIPVKTQFLIPIQTSN